MHVGQPVAKLDQTLGVSQETPLYRHELQMSLSWFVMAECYIFQHECTIII